ncbi:MAG TPA: urea amidolyase associated protein UAAP1 [Stellaceae bacterium]|nr:urea amidolyase associated protein UAAP1 [Stellaceae bacterium]
MAAGGGNDLGTVIEDTVVAAGGHWSALVERGNILRIIDLEGCQAVDFLCYNAADPGERYNAADTMKIAGSIFIGEGTKLYSGLGNPIFTVVRDTCGFHDTIGGCCSSESNFVRYGVRDTPNCRDNFLRGLAKFGLDRRDIVANVNFFMYVPVTAEGGMAIVDGRSKPGDHVDLRAEMDALAVLSNCPQVHNPANAYNPTPIRVIVARPAAAPG